MTPPLFVPALGRSLYPGASVALDFTRNLYRSGTPVVKGSPSLLSGWTFTRASTGYAETAAGALVAFAPGAPRITDKGLLVEEARTNYVTYSNAITGGAGVTVTSAVGSAPDGTLTAQRITKTDATTPRYSYHTASMAAAAATSYVVSRYFKYDGYDTTVSIEYNSAPYFDVSFTATFAVTASGITANAPTSCTSGVVAMADGWYRCWAAFTSGAAPTGVNGNPFLSRITGASGVTVQTFGSSLELGAFTTSYIPTTSASATRQADVASISGLSQAYPISMVLEAIQNNTPSASSGYVLTVDAGSFTDMARLAIASSLRVGLTVINGGSTTMDSYPAASVAVGVVYKVAARVGANNSAISLNGVAPTTDVSVTMPPAITHLRLGSASSGVAQPNTYICRAVVYPYAMTDAQLQAATT